MAKMREGIDIPKRMWFADCKDDGRVIIADANCFETKDDLKAYMDKIRLKYEDADTSNNI